MKITICRECKWNLPKLGAPNLDKCTHEDVKGMDYVTGIVDYHVYCDLKNTDGKCRDYEFEAPYWDTFIYKMVAVTTIIVTVGAILGVLCYLIMNEYGF